MFQLGRIVFRPESGDLSNGASSVRLEPRSAAVLAALANRRDEVVARQALLDTCWGVGNGSDEALTQSVAQFRRALGELGEPNLVETLARRGYRLRSTPAPSPGPAPAADGEPAAPRRRRAVLLAAAAAILLLVAWIALPHGPRHFIRHLLGFGPQQHQQGTQHGH